MNLSLLALQLLMTPIRYRTKSKLLSIYFKALFYLILTYFPRLIFTTHSSHVQESYALVSWTDFYSCSLGPPDISYSTGTLLLSTFSILWLLVSDAHQSSHKVFSILPEGINLLECMPSTHSWISGYFLSFLLGLPIIFHPLYIVAPSIAILLWWY